MATILGNNVIVSGNKYARVRIEWQLAGQETGNNRSLINWQAYVDFVGCDAQLDDGYVGWNGGGLYDNGGRVYNYAGNFANHTVGMGSGSFWVGHDGNGNASFSMNADVYVYQSGRSAGSGSFGLPQIPKPPHVQTYGPNSIGINSARMEGNVSWNGGVGLSQRGFRWGTSPNPTGNSINVGGGEGAFGYTLTGLTPNTTYHYRAYAINSQGTVYGANQSFTTLKLPEVISGAVSLITGTTARVTAEQIHPGNPAPTQRGFDYRTSPEPAQPHTRVIVAGNTNGEFLANLTGLNPSTTYYIRPFITNAAGTIYGNYLTFSTIVAPVMITDPATDVTTISATGNGRITSDGGGNILEHGFVWSTNPSPTLANSKVELGAGALGLFTGSITGLTPSTIYYYRSFATNEGGTSYGAQQIIDTEETPPLQPTIISPKDGVAVDNLFPTLTWQYNPGSGNDTQLAYQIQLVRQSDSVVMWDSGEVVSAVQTVVVPGTVTLAFDVDYQWRIKTWNQSDLEGPYSGYALFKTSQRPVVVMTFPTDESTIVTNTPTVEWTYADPEATPQASYRIRVSNSVVVYDSGTVISTDTEHEIPDGYLLNNQAYTIQLEVFDADGLSNVELINDFNIVFLAPAPPLVTATQDAAGIAQINVVVPRPPRDGWNADVINIYKRKQGDINNTPFQTAIPVTQGVLDTLDTTSGWGQFELAGEPTIGTPKYGSGSLEIGSQVIGTPDVSQASAQIGGAPFGIHAFGSGAQYPVTLGAGDVIYRKTFSFQNLNLYDTFSTWIRTETHNNFSSIDIKFGTDVNNYYLVSVPASEFVDGAWNSVHANKSEWQIIGNPSPTDIIWGAIEIKNVVATIPVGDVRVDHIRFLQSTYSFYDYETANGETLIYSASTYSTEGEVSSALAEAPPITIEFTEQYINTYLVPLLDTANMAKGFMDGTKVPNWSHKTGTKYYEPMGSTKPIALVNAIQSYREGSVELWHVDEDRGGQGLVGAEHVISIKNVKPLLLRTWWGRNYLISIDGDIDVSRKPGVLWISRFSFTEIN